MDAVKGRAPVRENSDEFTETPRRRSARKIRSHRCVRPGSGYHAASKRAIEGWSNALRAEVEPLGIGVTCVEPGPFRTDWAGRSLRQETRIADYAETAGRRLKGTRQINGTQAGDPVRAGEAMIAVAESVTPPRHLVLGAFGLRAVVDRMQKRLEEIRGHREQSLSADYPRS